MTNDGWTTESYNPYFFFSAYMLPKYEDQNFGPDHNLLKGCGKKMEIEIFVYSTRSTQNIF